MNAAVLSAATEVPAPGGADFGAHGATSRYGVLIGAQRLLLGADGAVRVLEPPPLYRLPNTHAWFLGIANVRGTLVPVYDLAAWLERPVPESRRMLLVIGDGESAAGVLVDASPRHLALAGAGTQQQAAGGIDAALAAHVLEAHDVAGETWAAIDWPTLFDELTTRALLAG